MHYMIRGKAMSFWVVKNPMSIGTKEIKIKLYEKRKIAQQGKNFYGKL